MNKSGTYKSRRPSGKRTSIRGTLQFSSAQFLRVIDAVHAVEMKHAFPRVIAVHPNRAKRNRAPRAGFRTKKQFFYFGETFRKIGPQLGGNFAFIPARTKNS